MLGQITSQAAGRQDRHAADGAGLPHRSRGQVEATTQKLLEDPILQWSRSSGAWGQASSTPKERPSARAFRQLVAKYPFQTTATQRATLQEVNAVFQPGQGALWTFYDSTLRNYLAKQGSQYAPNPSGGIALNPAFVAFFNRAAAFSDAVYPGGAATPQLAYTLRASAPKGVQSLTLSVDRQSLTTSGSKPVSMNFVWNGNPAQEVKLTGQVRRRAGPGLRSYDGLWAAFEFFGDATRWQTTGNVHRLDWVLRQGRAAKALDPSDGSPLTVSFDLEMPGAAPVFQKGFLSGLGCVARVAQ